MATTSAKINKQKWFGRWAPNHGQSKLLGNKKLFSEALI